jgi:conjugative relaxase-like TrwC/TraI family protein
VLTIGKLGATKGQLQYYERQIAAGMEDYYAGRGEARGTWRGVGARALGLGLGETVADGEFMALARGLSPVDGSVLRVMPTVSTVAAIDLTFSAPKSVSVLFAVADESVAGAMVAAHERAVDEALAYLEREACFTRRGHAGADRLRGEGFIAAGYRHRLSRAGDPQLHTHVVVGNLTRADGRYTALDAHALYEHKSAAGAVYRAVLRAQIRARLSWVVWRPAGRGLFEIDGVPEPVLRHFSQRREEIAERYRHAGYRVIGTAPTARAARELRDTAEIPAGTMHALISELDRAGGFPQRTVLVIDEAGMAPTRITAAIVAHAEQADTKVIAVGDPGQLASVQAGGWLASVARSHPGPELRQVIRQHDRNERAALEALHDGRPDRYLEHKQGELTVHPDAAAGIAALVDQWDAARRQHGTANAVMITHDNHTREQLNHAARDRLKRDGLLPGHGVRIAGREYARGDRIVTRHNDRRLAVDNGTLATITSIGPERLVVELGPGLQRQLDPGYVACHVEHAYALTAHSAQGATVEWAGVIGHPDDFTRQWAYTALSRARQQTTLHVVATPPDEAQHRSEFAPHESNPTIAQALATLQRRMRQVENEPLGIDQQRLRAALITAPPTNTHTELVPRLRSRPLASDQALTVSR